MGCKQAKKRNVNRHNRNERLQKTGKSQSGRQRPLNYIEYNEENIVRHAQLTVESKGERKRAGGKPIHTILEMYVGRII